MYPIIASSWQSYETSARDLMHFIFPQSERKLQKDLLGDDRLYKH